MKKRQAAHGARRRDARMAAIGVRYERRPDCLPGRAWQRRDRSINRSK
jgi:hypothetical protein